MARSESAVGIPTPAPSARLPGGGAAACGLGSSVPPCAAPRRGSGCRARESVEAGPASTAPWKVCGSCSYPRGDALGGLPVSAPAGVSESAALPEAGAGAGRFRGLARRAGGESPTAWSCPLVCHRGSSSGPAPSSEADRVVSGPAPGWGSAPPAPAPEPAREGSATSPPGLPTARQMAPLPPVPTGTT